MGSDKRSDPVTDAVREPISFRYSLAAGLLSLALVLGLSGLVAGLVLQQRFGADGWWAAAVAAAVCFQGGAVGLVASTGFRGKYVAVGSLLVMQLRLLLPLGLLSVLYARGDRLIEVGVVETMIFFYQVALVVETWWLVGRARHELPSRES